MKDKRLVLTASSPIRVKAPTPVAPDPYSEAEGWLSCLLSNCGLSEEGIREVVSEILHQEEEEVYKPLPEKPTPLLEQQQWALYGICQRIDELLEQDCDPLILVTSVQTAVQYAIEQIGGLEENGEENE